MKSDRHWPVAIIGAGFSGTMAAAQLARKGIESVVVEAGGRAGLGVAYSTTDAAHLLNVPAAKMSAWPDAPDDFARAAGEPGAFAERRDFGAYLRSILGEALETGATLISDRAVAASRDDGRWVVTLQNEVPITADALVLATGNQPPGRLSALEGAGNRLIANPWGGLARAAIEDAVASHAEVLIVGTGLTMVDVVLSLDSAGHRGGIVAVSRRGQIPRAHAAHEQAPVELQDAPKDRVTALLTWLRTRGAEFGWRASIDSLRPHSQLLWRALPLPEKQRFLRHARPWWDVHRHRIAPQVASKLAELIAGGQLRIVAGRILSCRGSDRAVEVTIAKRGAGEMRGTFAYVFNCTGPLGDIRVTADPLLKSLLDGGLAQADALGIGLAVDDRARAHGTERLWALGPLTKGCLWEIIAVPDIRNQAAQVADDIARELLA